MEWDQPIYLPQSIEKGERLRDRLLYFYDNSARSPIHLVGQLYLFLDELIEFSSSQQNIAEKEQKDFYINEAVAYIQQNQRLTNATELMRLTELPIKAIAAQCGYPNQLYFSQVFKKSYGLSPQE